MTLNVGNLGVANLFERLVDTPLVLANHRKITGRDSTKDAFVAIESLEETV
jgi:hypothetical protein